MTTRHQHANDGDGQAGAVSVFVAVVAVGLLVGLGLVVDGGTKLRATVEADQVAAEAARAGGQALDTTAAVDGRAIRVDPARAAAAARAWLAARGLTGTVTVSGDRRRITVTTTVTRPTTVLSLIGLGTVTVTGQAEAQLLDTPTRESR